MNESRSEFQPLKQTAFRLGVPAAWLRDEAEHGRVPAIRCGRRLVFDAAAVADCLRRRAMLPVLAAEGGDDGSR